jgi:translation initiation factor IF-3
MAQDKVNLNEKIRSPRVILIDEEGKNLGNFSIREALLRAKTVGLDLVEVGGKDIPVCKIIDYGKLKYEQTKKTKAMAKNQVIQVVKEIKFKPNTGNNDLLYRAKQVDSFLKEKNKVKISVKFRGREMEHFSSTGFSIVNRFLAMLTESFKYELEPQRENNSLTLIIVAQ